MLLQHVVILQAQLIHLNTEIAFMKDQHKVERQSEQIRNELLRLNEVKAPLRFRSRGSVNQNTYDTVYISVIYVVSVHCRGTNALF